MVACVLYAAVSLRLYCLLAGHWYLARHLRHFWLANSDVQFVVVCLQVDYASRECQKNFLEHLGKSGQLSSGSRFDERSMSKMPQHYADYHDSLMKE